MWARWDGCVVAGRWRIAEQVSEGAIAPDVRGALGALGYEFFWSASSGGSAQALEADLWIVDEENVADIPRPSSGSLRPIIVLTAEPGRSSSDARIVASLARPVSLSALYAVLQRALENTPRRAPRVRTDLAARCWHGNRFWTGAVLSLSETGCLFRSLPEPPPEREVTLVFELPSDQTVSTWASPVGLRGQDVALCFENVRPDSRIAISQHVVARLTGTDAGPSADSRGPGEGPSG